MNKIVLSGCAVLAACAASVAIEAFAGELDVPNQFQTGTPAIAAEVNENFDAVKAAVDDNAKTIAAAEGIAVRLDGVAVGRYFGYAPSSIYVEASPISGITGPVIVSQWVTPSNSGALYVLSATGYRFSIATTDFKGTPHLSEGKLSFVPIYFDDATCTGNKYFPVQGDTGHFSIFDLDNGLPRPVKAWSFRQGVTFASPDPDDATPVYMIRRGQTAQTVPLLSYLVWSSRFEETFCVDFDDLPDFDANDPNDVNHPAFAIEPADALETGVSGTLGGQITVGL